MYVNLSLWNVIFPIFMALVRARISSSCGVLSALKFLRRVDAIRILSGKVSWYLGLTKRLPVKIPNINRLSDQTRIFVPGLARLITL